MKKPKRRDPGKAGKKTAIKAASTKPRDASTRTFRFDEGRGKTVEFVEFHTASGAHVLEIRFADQTALHFYD